MQERQIVVGEQREKRMGALKYQIAPGHCSPDLALSHVPTHNQISNFTSILTISRAFNIKLYGNNIAGYVMGSIKMLRSLLLPAE